MPDAMLIVSHDLEEFFLKELACAKRSLGIEISELTEYYLVNLLCEFAQHTHCPDLGKQPLALQYKSALESLPNERVRRLKDLGDESLYVAGFFSEFIERSLVSVGYYISMGGTAYGSLSGLIGAHQYGATRAELFWQLAANFPHLVELLNQVSDQTRSKTDNNELLHLYERWLRTGSTRVQRLLHERGLFVREGLPNEFSH
jgi:hypothetical protein